MHPVLAMALVVVFAFLFIISLRLGITGAGIFLLMSFGGYLIYRTGYLQGSGGKPLDKKEKRPEISNRDIDPDEPGPFG